MKRKCKDNKQLNTEEETKKQLNKHFKVLSSNKFNATKRVCSSLKYSYTYR